MFWLEVQALFEMSVVMTPSREDMSKVYEKFFRQGSGFYVHELAIKPQVFLWTGSMYFLVNQRVDEGEKQLGFTAVMCFEGRVVGCLVFLWCTRWGDCFLCRETRCLFFNSFF